MDKYGQLKQLILEAEKDFIKFSDGNQTAGTRIRQKMLCIKKIAHGIRQDVSDIKNNK